MTDFDKAIRDLRMMRRTHVRWYRYFKRNPEIEARYVATGEWDDAAEHARLVAMYDNAIACLKAARRNRPY